jgi:uncharacterized protein (DUF1697 family)
MSAPAATNAYVAFLRGINVGGNRKIEMADLRRVLAEAGFTKIKTILASGNVLFETSETDVNSLQRAIEENLQRAFTHNISVILRSREQIQALVEANPFQGIEVTPQTRLYVTFLPEAPYKTVPLHDIATERNFQILKVDHGEVISVLTLMPEFGTVDSMEIIEKEFGKKVTTRNWNTIIKINNGWL